MEISCRDPMERGEERGEDESKMKENDLKSAGSSPWPP